MKKMHLAIGILAVCTLHQTAVDAQMNSSTSERQYRLAVGRNPQDQTAHYYLANFLAKNRRHIEAIEEYTTAFNLNQSSSIGGYCRQALNAYKYPNARPASTAYAPYNYGGTAAGGTYVNGTGVRVPEGSQSQMSRYADALLGNTAPPQAPSKAAQVNSATSTIQRELQEAKSNNQIFADNLSKSTVKGADWKGRDIRQQAEDEIQMMYETQYVSSRGRSGKRYDNSAVLKARADAMRREAEEKANYERALADERSRNHKEWARERQQDLDNTAANLNEQMTAKPSPYGTDINPAGTGLYVRNYKARPGKKKLPDPHFSVARFVDKGYEGLGSGDGDDGLLPEQPPSNADESTGVKEVKGKLAR